MRSRKFFATAATAALALVLGVLPASAATSGSTSATVTLSGVVGTLSISVPDDSSGAIDLGAINVGTGTFSTPNGLGTVTVTDTSTGLLRVATVTADVVDSPIAFCVDDGAGSCSTDTNEQILAANVAYQAGTVTVGGSGSDGTVTKATALGAPVVTYTQAGASPGDYTFSWDPTFDLTLLSTQSAGTYGGTITHSVTAAGV